MPDHGQNITFRADHEKIERLDDLILQWKAGGDLERDVTRSDLLRGKIDEKMAELEALVDGSEI